MFLMGQFMVLKCALPKSVRKFLCDALQHKGFRVALSICIVGTIQFWSCVSPPMLLHPMYACKLWLVWQFMLLLGSVVIIRLLMIVQNRRTRLPMNDAWLLIMQAIRSVIWPCSVALIIFLYGTNEEYYTVRLLPPLVPKHLCIESCTKARGNCGVIFRSSSSTSSLNCS